MRRQKMRSGGTRGAGTRAPALVLLGLGASTCTPLFGGFATDNPDNCVRNAGLCQAPAEACNPLTKLCEPAVLLTDIAPPGGTNRGGELVTLTGDRFVPGMTVSFDGVPALAVTVSSGQQLTAMTPPRPGRQGPVAVELVHPEGQRVQRDKLFRYYAEASFQQQCFQGPSGARAIAVADFNGDGRADLGLGGFSLVHVYLSSGDGLTFQGPSAISPGGIPQRLAAADVNGDYDRSYSALPRPSCRRVCDEHREPSRAPCRSALSVCRQTLADRDFVEHSIRDSVTKEIPYAVLIVIGGWAV